MNKIYSKVWSKSLGMLIVANEFARVNGKGGHSRRIRHALAVLPLGVLLALGAAPATAADAATGAPHSIEAAASIRATAAARTSQQAVVGPAGPIADVYFAADGVADGSDDASANGARSVAGGASSAADGEEATSYGAGSYAGDDFSTAIGGNATAIGAGASAFGNSATTLGEYATALGTSATADDDHSLALGAFSQASAAYAVALGVGSIADRANSVSLGSTGNERQITHLAAGTADTDAVNLAQLNLAIADVDGGAGNPLAMAYDDATKATATLAGASGTVLANVAAGEVSVTSTDAINGSQLNSTNEAVAQNTGDIATHTTDIATLNQAIADVEGGTNPYFAADGAGDGSDDANALGASSTAGGASSTADGEEATSYGAGSYAGDDFSTAIGGNATAIGAGASAFGNSAATLGEYATALGTSATADDDHSLALGAFSQASAAYAVALGAGSIADRANSVSLGSTGNERQITHLAAGTADTDAVNLAQLNLAIADVDGGAGNPLAMVYDDATKATATLAGASGTVLANVAAGDVNATSTDAVNGSQLNSTNQAVAQNTSDIADNTVGIATNTTSIATNTASIDTINTIAVFYTDATQAAVSLGDGVTPVALGNVADGTAATDAVNKGQLDTIAAQAGATGALAVKYDDATKGRASLAGTSGTVLANVANGDVSATSSDAVNGSQLNRTNEVVAQNTSDIATNATAIGTHTLAIDNINTMAVFYTDASHTAVSLGDGSTPVTLGNVADGTAATDAVNKGQLDAVATQAGATDALAVKYDDAGNDQVTLGGASGSRISNLQASDVRTDAATAGQIADVLAIIGGGAMLQAGGTISPPSFMVQGGVYGNVGDALGALDHAFNGISRRVGDVEQRANFGNGTNAQVAVDGSGHGGDAASVVPGSKGVAVGAGAKAGGSHGTAVGGDSYAAGPNDTAIGGNAKVNADGSTAVGANTTIDAAATNAVAVGEGSKVTVASGTAVGQGSSVTAAGAVALGRGSVADRANTVSVGTAANTRQITNVAAGTRATDAASLGQVQEALVTAKTYADAGDKATLNAANTYTDNKLGGMVSATDFDTFRGQVNHQFTGVNRRLDRVGAMGTAMAQMTANTSGLAGDNRIGVGAGNYGGQSAISVGYQRAFNRNRASISVGGSASGSESTVGIGAGFSW